MQSCVLSAALLGGRVGVMWGRTLLWLFIDCDALNFYFFHKRHRTFRTTAQVERYFEILCSDWWSVLSENRLCWWYISSPTVTQVTFILSRSSASQVPICLIIALSFRVFNFFLLLKFSCQPIRLVWLQVFELSMRRHSLSIVSFYSLSLRRCWLALRLSTWRITLMVVSFRCHSRYSFIVSASLNFMWASQQIVSITLLRGG